MSMSVSTESSGFLCSWKTSSRRTYALGWRKWREVRSTPRRPPCWRWEPISSASRPSRRVSWRTWKLRWARRETLSRSRCPRVAWRQPAKMKNGAKTNKVRLQMLDKWPIKCKSDVTRRGVLPSQKVGGGGRRSRQNDWRAELSWAELSSHVGAKENRRVSSSTTQMCLQSRCVFHVSLNVKSQQL